MTNIIVKIQNKKIIIFKLFNRAFAILVSQFNLIEIIPVNCVKGVPTALSIQLLNLLNIYLNFPLRESNFKPINLKTLTAVVIHMKAIEQYFSVLLVLLLIFFEYHFEHCLLATKAIPAGCTVSLWNSSRSNRSWNDPRWNEVDIAWSVWV